MDDSYITPEQLAERWKVKVTTLKQWRWNGKGPIYSKVGNCIFYWPHDVDAYEKSKRRRHTSDQITSPCQMKITNNNSKSLPKAPSKIFSH
jgi:hypothetical protein